MKRIYVAFVLILTSVGLCIFSSTQVEKYAVNMQLELREIADMINNKNTVGAQKRLEEAEKQWQKTEKLFSFLVDADKIEDMNIGFSMIKAHLSDKNIEHALERLRECDFMLDEIVENEKLSFKNIM